MNWICKHILYPLVIFPFQADLIHLGAKFSPCMHRDAQVYEEIGKAKSIENDTGCCIRTDQSGCVQTLQDDCSVSSLEFWSSWSCIYSCSSWLCSSSFSTTIRTSVITRVQANGVNWHVVKYACFMWLLDCILWVF